MGTPEIGSDWVQWGGGGCPVSDDDAVQVRMRSGVESFIARGSSVLCWSHRGSLGDIIAYRLAQDVDESADDGWTEWDGGEAPRDAWVEVKLRNGMRTEGLAERLDWGIDDLPSDIIAYRLAQAVEESAPACEYGIGDVTSTEKGSGARYNGGKLNYALLPLCTLEDEVRVWMHGEKKYATFNWAKGMPWSAPLASLMRHMAAWQRGEENDPESGLPHLAHAMCNLRMLTLYSKTYREGDDRPKEWLK